MSVNIRIKHKVDPKRPKAPEGIVEIEVNGRHIELPMKGYDKVLIERPSAMHMHTEQGKDDQEI